MLGAEGVQMGTRFLLATECRVHENYKKMVLAATDTSTIATGRRFGGNTCRQLKNKFSRNFTTFEYSAEAAPESVPRSRRRCAQKSIAVEGDKDAGCFLAGQIAGMLNKEQSAEEIVTRDLQ